MNSPLDIILIVSLVLAAIGLLIYSINRNSVIKNLLKEKDVTLQTSVSLREKIGVYKDFFDEKSNPFSFIGLQIILDFINTRNTETPFNKLFGEKQQKDIQTFFHTIQGMMFEKFILDLPMDAGSFIKIINFNYKYLFEKYSIYNDEVRKKVMGIWQRYVATLPNERVINEAFEMIKSNPFFDKTFDPDDEKTIPEWYVILTNQMDILSEHSMVSLHDEMKGMWSIDLVCNNTNCMIGITQRRHLSSSGKKHMMELLKPSLTTSIQRLSEKSGESIETAEKCLEFRKIQERLFPKVAEPA